jgi:hypothetical protein
LIHGQRLDRPSAGVGYRPSSRSSVPSILQKLFGRRSPSEDGGAPAAFVATFGKHPAWNDFADDLGLETDRLIDLKRLVMQGIDANAAQWDHLHEQQRLDALRHLLVWVTAQGVVVARMWSSSDGKGRQRYPMVACAECRGVGPAAVLGHVPALLERVEQECRRATTQPEVAAALDRARAELRQWAASPAAAAAPGDLSPAEAAARLASCPALGEPRRGLTTLLYRLDQEAPQLLTWGRDARGAASDSRTGPLRPAYLRLPACAAAPADAALLWSRFLSAVVSRRASCMVILPAGERWADLVIGDPTPASLYCLRANEKGVPLTTDIPYSIDAGFADKAGQFLATLAPTGPTNSSRARPGN